MQGRIQLHNMAFYGYHGHHPEENKRGQRFLVDLVLDTDIARAASSDRLADAVDYARAYAVCRKIMENERVKLLETLCQRIIAAILKEFRTVSRVEITIKKPSAPIPGVLDYVAVTAASDRPNRLRRARK